MFDEKFKIRVSDFLRQVLELDAIAFNFTKANGEGNLNAFLNKLIPNLLRKRKERRVEVLNYAREAFGIDESETIVAETFINEMNILFEKVYFSDSELNQLSQVIWIRPTKENIAVFDEILDSETEITGQEVSVYIRTLLNEYARFPKYKKEQITFSEECGLTLLARESGRILKFRYEGELHRAFVFGCLYDYLEEQGNYVLCYDMEYGIICRYQISEITALHLFDKKYTPGKKLSELCRKYLDEGLWLDDEVYEVGDLCYE